MESKMKDPISKWANEAQKRNKEEFMAMRQAECEKERVCDEAYNAMYHYASTLNYINDRLDVMRRTMADYVDEIYDPAEIARFDELVKLKNFINNLKNK
jgi:hypothetical protein